MRTWLDRLTDQKRALLAGKDVQVLAGEKLEVLKKTDAAGPRTFSMLAYSGAQFSRWYGQACIDLAGMKPAGESLVSLFEHDDREAIGVITKFEPTAEGLRCEGHLLSNPRAQEIAKNADEGVPYRCSVGVRVESREQLEDGAEAEVNGRTVRGPLEIWRQTRLFEVSFITANPADLATTVEVMSQEPSMKLKPEEIEAFLKANPELAAKLRSEGAQDQEQKLQARLDKFLKAFPKRPKFARAAALSGKTLVSVLKAELKKSAKDETPAPEKPNTKTLAELKAQANHPGIGFAGAERDGGTDKPDYSRLPVEERAKQEWLNDPTLRECFRSEKHYASYLRAEAAGLKKTGLIAKAAESLLEQSLES